MQLALVHLFPLCPRTAGTVWGTAKPDPERRLWRGVLLGREPEPLRGAGLSRPDIRPIVFQEGPGGTGANSQQDEPGAPSTLRPKSGFIKASPCQRVSCRDSPPLATAEQEHGPAESRRRFPHGAGISGDRLCCDTRASQCAELLRSGPLPSMGLCGDGAALGSCVHLSSSHTGLPFCRGGRNVQNCSGSMLHISRAGTLQGCPLPGHRVTPR